MLNDKGLHTILGNLETSLSGNYLVFYFEELVMRYLAPIAYRLIKRFAFKSLH